MPYTTNNLNLNLFMFFMFDKELYDTKTQQTYTPHRLKIYTKRPGRNNNITNRSTHKLKQPQWRGHSH